MKKNRLGRTGFDISVITYGGIVSTMQNQEGYDYAGDKQSKSDAHVEYAINHGINYFDVAPSYGDAELRLGNSLIPYRKDIILAGKTNVRDYEGAKREFDRTLELLHTDHLDNYQLHGLCNIEEVEMAFSVQGVMRLVEDMKSQGVIANAGITAHSEGAALKALEYYDFDTVLFPFNWHMNMALGYGDRLLQVANERNMGKICMKSNVERAFIDGVDDEYRKRYPKSWCKTFDPLTDEEILIAAMKYSWGLGVNTIIPPGDFDHLVFAMEHSDIITEEPMTDKEMTLLSERLEIVREHLFMPENDR